MSLISIQNIGKKCLKRFSIEWYRQALRAWRTDIDGLSAGADTSGQPNETPINRSLAPEVDYSSEKLFNKTIELNTTLESIPETPEIVSKRKRKLKSNKTIEKSKKRSVSEFIDFESEVALDSMESLSDDIEDTQKDLEIYSQTYIDDNRPMDSQPIGQMINGIDSRNSEDMLSVYLRSVKDGMVGKSDKYKLQFNYDPNIDVYSQEPNESELEDYEMDSFCVPNDCIVFDNSPEMATNSIQSTHSTETKRTLRKRKFKRIVFSP